MQIGRHRIKAYLAQRTAGDVGGIKDMIPVDLHIRPDADAVVVGKKLVGQLHHQRFVLSFGKAEVLNHRFPVSFVINHLQKRKNGAGRR